VASSDATKMLDAVDQAFDVIAAAVLAAQQASREGAARPRGNHGCASVGADFCDKLVTVVSLVRDQVAGIMVTQQAGGWGPVVGLPRREDPFDRTPRRLDGDVQLGAESAARTAEGFVVIPFFLAPAACRWARRTVESSLRPSRSGSCQACKSRAHTPCLHQRLNRWKTEFHSPKRSGKSRQGAPVLAIHRTALTKLRLSSAVRPGSPGLPGRRSLIFSQRSSEISCRRIAAFLREPTRRSLLRPPYAQKIGADIGIGTMNVNRT
jgi:hypothetical protein